jgi:hypothetical protein
MCWAGYEKSPSVKAWRQAHRRFCQRFQSDVSLLADNGNFQKPVQLFLAACG